jgi:hypothetical protein
LLTEATENEKSGHTRKRYLFTKTRYLTRLKLKQPVLNYLDAVLFTKINNYKDRKKTNLYKVERLEKASLKMETENHSEYSFKTNYNCNILNNSTHLKL